MSKYFSSNQTSDSLPYDNTASGLAAENAKDAIDELSVEKLDKSDNLLIDPQVVRVKLSNAGDGEFTDLSLAIASITDADPDTKPYIIEVGAGVHTVNNPIVLPSGVSLRGEGINATIILPQNAAQHTLVLNVLCEVSFLSLKGISGSIGSGKAAIYCEDSGNFAQVHKVSIYDFDIAVDNYANTADSTLYLEYVDVNGDYIYGVRTRSNGVNLAYTQAENFYSYPSNGVTPIHIYATGPGSTTLLNSAGLSGAVNTHGIVLADGAIFSGSDVFIKDFTGTGKGFVSENTGAGPALDLTGVIFTNNTDDAFVDNPNTTGVLNITADKSKVTIDDLAEVTVFITDSQVGGITLVGELNYSPTDFSKVSDIGPLVTTASTMGVLIGGELSAGTGLTLNVSELKGYLSTGTPPNNAIKYYQLAAQTISITASANNYIYINSSGTLVQNASFPNTVENILLGRVVSDGSSILYIAKAPLDSRHFSNKIDKVFREAIGSVYASGSLVSENGTRGLNVTSGRFFYSETVFEPSGGTGISFDAFYESSTPGVYTRVAAQTIVDNAFYDDGTGTLAAIPATKYVKHLFLVMGGPSEAYILVYGTAIYNTLAEAQSAPLPTSPPYMFGAFSRVASIIVQQGATNIQDIIDERPRVGFASSSSVGGVTSHSALSDLGVDSHNIYLPTSGSRPMTGSLDMGGNNITNVNLVDGIDVTTHASRHAFNGLDPFLSNTPQTVGTANAEGTSNTQFSRADHIHAHGNQTGPTQHAVATTGANGFMSSTDKTKLDAIGGNRIIKAGVVAGATFAGAPRTATVTFGTAMPNTNYSIAISGANSRSWSYQTKTVNGFVINANANAALSGEVTWTCISHGESVE